MAFVIAGGGIAGLATALGLARAGREVAIFEAAPAFEETGAGLQLGPNGVKALMALGAWEQVEPFCFSPPAIHVRDGTTGKTLKRISLSGFAARFGAPYRVLHRADLLAGLLAAARAQAQIRLHTGRRATGFAPEGLQFETGPAEPFAALIGADGIRSRIRAQLLADGPPQFAGQVIARALVPRTQLAALEPDVTLWLCPGGHVVTYPVSAGQMMNLVAAFDGGWAEEGWSAEMPREELFSAFPEACVDLHYALGVPQGWRKWAGASRPPARQWGQANITLIGDAAHPTLPYLAQGAVMALEDAATLGSMIAREPRIPAALRAYEAARQGRTARITAAASGLARVYHARGIIRQGRDFVMKTMPESLALARMAPLYDWNPPA